MISRLVFVSLLLVPSLPALPLAEPHPLQHRVLWTRDTWISDYDAGGGSFLAETKDLVDWMARREYTDLILWGFVDGRHGGEAAAKELARYARTKGIRLSPGVSTDVSADGAAGGFALGIPNHPFNDEVQIQAMAATRRPGERNLCYGRAENRDWLLRGTEWMLDTFDVDGLHFEVAEGGSRCGCADCTARLAAREGPPGGASYGDLEVCVPIIADVFRQKRPEGLVSYAALGLPWWKLTPKANDLLKRIPEAAAALWNLDLEHDEKAASPVRRNLAFVHGGGTSFHLRRRQPEAWASGQFRGFSPRIEPIRRFCGNLRKMKLDGFVVGSVGSPKCPDNELAYLAYIDFSRNPELTLDEFYRNRLSELYGADAADDVQRLFQRQAAVHADAYPFWLHYNGSWTGDATRASQGLAEQIALARSIGARASADGKRRIDALLEVLGEYKIICDTAVVDISATRRRLSELYGKAGLPDDIYQYSKWSK
jgi:hypothetical protein